MRRGAVLLAVLVLPAALPVLAGESSAKGRLLHTRLTDGTWQVWQKDLATQQLAQVTFTAGDKRAPVRLNSDRIAYCTSSQTCFSGKIGEPGQDPLLRSLWPIREVAVSPDGSRIVFSKLRTDLVDQANLWIADGPDGHARILTTDPGVQQHPAWSPDGRWIAYSAGDGPDTYEIYVIAADGSQRRRLTTNQAQDLNPAWSPDGRSIAYSSNATGDYEIWVMDADGANARQVTDSRGLDSRPVWLGGGGQIAFLSNRSGSLQLWAAAADGAAPQLLETADGGVNDARWEP